MTVADTLENSETPDRVNSSPARTWQFKPFVLPLILLAAQLPLLIEHGEYLWSRTHYRFFPILLLAIVVLGWMRWPRVYEPLTRFWRRVAWLLLLTGVAILAAATLLASPNVAALAFVFTSGGLLLLLGGRLGIRTILPVWLLTWLLVPPPLRLDVRLITGLQTFTSTSTSVILELLGIEHLMTGNVLHLPGKTFLVEEACSGVQSLFALLAATAIYLVWQPRSWINGILLLLSVIGWALFANVLRVFTIAYAYDQSSLDLSTGWQHEALGYGTFAVALLMIVSTDQLFAFFLSPIEDMSPIEHEQSPFSRFWNRLFGRPQPASAAAAGVTGAAVSAANPARFRGAVIWLPAAMVLLCGLIQLANWHFSQTALANYRERAAQASATIEEQTLPERVGEWGRVGFRVEQRDRSNILGENSKTWTYLSPGGPAVFSCDYPFFGWHELVTCYQGQGWQPQRAVLHKAKQEEDTGDRGAFLECEMTRADEYAYLVYGHFDGVGRDVQPPDAGFLRRAISRLNTGLQRGPLRLLIPMGLTSLDSTTYQVQVFITADKPIPAEERAKVREKFERFRESLKRHWSDYAQGSTKQ